MKEKDLLYKRILLKISGEALKGNREHGYDPEAVSQIVVKIRQALDSFGYLLYNICVNT